MDSNLGRRLGVYELVQRIGEGGMGVVYRARRTDTGEAFAVKLIKRGMDTESVLRRFDTERRILESLNHPNIARILDAGATPEGLPYFVMEHIPGRPVSEYCDENRLTLDARLRLFEKVCSAVECAHQSMVVHRDIKPQNILVTADGEPKLLDFGIAKVLDLAGPTQDATITIIPVMTPHYASPEQARGARVTSASDIYSLGVLLYELLAGCSPYRPTGSSPAALVHAIAQENAQRPSAAVGRMPEDDPKAQEIAAQRATTLPQLRRELAGDLDAIVLTALHKDPVDRYRTAAEFAADIRRHLEGVRVAARNPVRRVSRLLSHHRTAILTVAVLVVAVALFAAILRNTVARSAGVRPSVAVLGFENLSKRPAADWLSTALTEMLSTELAAGGRLRTVPGELVTRVKMEMDLPNSQTLTKPTLSRLRENLGADYIVVGAYLTIGEGADQKVRLDLRLQDTRSGELVASAADTRTTLDLVNLVTNAGTLLRRQLGAGPTGQADSASVRGSMPDGAAAAKNYSEGIERLRTFDAQGARELLKKAVIEAPGHALSHAALAAASNQLGFDVEARDEAKKALDLSAGLRREDRLSIEGRYFETVRQWDKAVGTYRTLFQEYPDNLEYGLRLAAAQSKTGDPRGALATIKALRLLPSAAYDPRIDLEEAQALVTGADYKAARAAAARAAEAGAARGMRILSAEAHLVGSRIAIESGDPQGALAEAAQAQQLYLAAGQRQGVAWALNDTAGALTQRGDVAGARARYEEALAMCRTVGDQSCIGTDLDSLGVLRRRQGDLRGAQEMHKEALESRRAVGDRAGVATSLYNLGNVLEIVGDLPRAHQAAAESLSIRQQLNERRTAALTMSRLANIRRREGELAEAQRISEEAVASLRSIGDRGGLAMALFNLGQVFLDRGELARSRSVLEEALAIRREQRDRNNTAQVTAGLARIALAQDRLSDAAALVAESAKLRQELGENIALAESRLIEAEIFLDQKKAAAAEAAARHSAATYAKAGAWGRQGEAQIVIARAQLAQGAAVGASAALASADRPVKDSKDARLKLWYDCTLARVLDALGQKDEAAAILSRALAESQRLGYPGMALEIRFANVAAGRGDRQSLAADAQQAGFLLIARKAR